MAVVDSKQLGGSVLIDNAHGQSKRNLQNHKMSASEGIHATAWSSDTTADGNAKQRRDSHNTNLTGQVKPTVVIRCSMKQ